MDLRVTKTNQSIKDAFLSLRAKTPLDKIKVKDICNIASINKTTFYKYYQDIYALSDKLEDESISLFVNTFTGKDYLFLDPYKFMMEMRIAAEYYYDLLKTLFRENRMIFIDKLTLALIHYYQPENYTIASEIQLTFILNGIFATTFDMKDKYSNEEIAKYLAEIIKKCV